MRRLRDLALPAVGLALFLLLCRHFGLDGLETAFRRFRPTYLVLYLCLAAAVRAAYGVRWWVVARAVGQAPRLWRLVQARLAGDAAGFLLPGARVGGDPLRVALVYGEGTGASVASAAVAADRGLELVGNTLCGLAYVTVFTLSAASPSAYAGVALVATLLLLLAALFVPVALLRRGIRPFGWVWPTDAATAPVGGWRSLLHRTEDHLQILLREHPRGLVFGIVGSVLIEMVIVLEYAALLAAFGLHLGLPTLLLALVATGIGRAVPAPAGVGSLEASQVAALSVAGSGAELGFVVGMIIRLHETFWLAIGLWALAARGLSLARLRRLRTDPQGALPLSRMGGGRGER